MEVVEHRTIFADRFAYCAHPHGVRLPGGDILVVFNRAPRRDFILHPPQDPCFENVLVRSTDGGASWSAPTVVPAFGWSGVECAGLTVLARGRVLLNQWRFQWYPLPAAHRHPAEPLTFPHELAAGLLGSAELESGATVARDPERLMPWARGGGETFVHISDDDGNTWGAPVAIDTAPYAGGYGMRGAAELGDGTLVLPLSDVPRYRRVFVVSSQDGGESWSAPVAAAEAEGLEFEEPAPLALASGRLLVLLRENRTRSLFATHSDDGGATWADPRPAGIDGYPAHLLALPGGAILCTFGDRRPPFAIRAAISADGGATWPSAAWLTIRENLPNKDLGYPFTLPLPPDRFITIYYAQDSSGTTGIHATLWRF